MGVGTSEGLGLIAGLVRFAEFDVGGRARLAPRDGPRGQNHVFRPLRGIARRFVRARHISCRECGLADLPHVPGSCETPRMRCEGGGTKPAVGAHQSPRRLSRWLLRPRVYRCRPRVYRCRPRGRSRGRSRVARRRSRVEGGDARIEHTCLAVSAVIKIRDPRVASLYLRPEDLTYDIPASSPCTRRSSMP